MRLVLDVRPKAYQRVRVTRGQAYNPREYEEWKQMVADLIALYTRRLKVRFDGPVEVEVTVERERLTLLVDEHPTVRPKGLRGDLDNYAKAALDALVASGVLVDDRQVVRLSAAFK